MSISKNSGGQRHAFSHIDDFLAKIGPYSVRGKGWKACCPAHDDNTPSLDIDVGDNESILLQCRSAKCPPTEIVAALGLTMADLFPAKDARKTNQRGKSKSACAKKPNRNAAKREHSPSEPHEPEARIPFSDRTTTGAWKYFDEHGVMLFETVRLEPGDNGKSKTFAQRREIGWEAGPVQRPDGTFEPVANKWEWRIVGKVKVVPYRFPELVAAIKAGVTPATPLLIVEGEKCVDALVKIGFDATTNPMGAEKFGKLDPDAIAKAFTGRRVVILPDNDIPGWKHAEDVTRRLSNIAASVVRVCLPGLPPKGDVFDWLKIGGTREQLIEFIDNPPPEVIPAEKSPTGPDDESGPNANRAIASTRKRNLNLIDAEEVEDEQHVDDGRIYVKVLRENIEAETTDEVISAIGGSNGKQDADKSLTHHRMFQREGQLVRIIVTDQPQAEAVQNRSEAFIRPHTVTTLRDAITRLVGFEGVKETRDGPIDEAVSPPEWCVRSVLERGVYPSLPRLSGVVNHPIVRPDGSILSKPGYDEATGLYLHWPHDPLELLENPTREDARNAVGVLVDLVSDFPFVDDDSRAGWLAALLTPLARHSFSGPAPLFLVEANTPGTGKGKLLNVAARILTGRPFPNLTYPRTISKQPDESELQKLITSHLNGGGQVALFDNLNGDFGDAVLENVLTCERWDGRLLGGNSQCRVVPTVTWYATGNNVRVVGETFRRVCRIRLESRHQNPEERRDYKEADIFGHTERNRNKYLTAAFTILQAYLRAGRPSVNAKTWGSFERWTPAVCEPLIWAGCCDAGNCRLSGDDSSDQTMIALGQLMDAMDSIDPQRNGLTSRQLCEFVDDKDPFRIDICNLLDDALSTLTNEKVNSRSVGIALRKLLHRPGPGNRTIHESTQKQGQNRWAVRETDEAVRISRPSRIPSVPATQVPTSESQPATSDAQKTKEVKEVKEVSEAAMPTESRGNAPAGEGSEGSGGGFSSRSGEGNSLGNASKVSKSPPTSQKTRVRFSGKRSPVEGANP